MVEVVISGRVNTHGTGFKKDKFTTTPLPTISGSWNMYVFCPFLEPQVHICAPMLGVVIMVMNGFDAVYEKVTFPFTA